MSDIIYIEKKDDVHLKVTAEPYLLHELSDYFTFEVPGAKFSPKFKSKLWDGRIRLFNMFTGELYIGLISHIKDFCKKREYEFTNNIPLVGDTITPPEWFTHVQGLNLHSGGDKIEARDYQLDAGYRGVRDARILLLSPTASGKSLIIYTMLRWHHAKGRKQLIIVPTTSLVEQLYGDFQDYASHDPWEVSDHTAVIYSGKEKTNKASIVISTWQSLYKLPSSFFMEFDVVYGDECHLFKAKSLVNLLQKTVATPFKIGTTGTLDGTQTHRLVLEGLFGPVHTVTSTKELMKNKQLVDLNISCVLLKWPDAVCKSFVKTEYADEIDWIVTHPQRNAFITNLSLDQKGNTLVLYQFVEKHGKVLYESIRAKASEHRKVFFVHGQVGAEIREDIRRITEKERDAIIVASYGTFSTGINIRNLDNIILASPSKSRIRNLQSIGRGLRIAEGKTTCKLYDIADDLSWKSYQNHTLKHMMERIKIYNQEEFDYKVFPIPMRGS